MKNKVIYLAHKPNLVGDEDRKPESKPFPFTAMVVTICVVTLIAAIAIPWLVGIPYDRAFFEPNSQKLLAAFSSWFVIWTVLGLFWQVPPQYLVFPALSFLQLGYAIASYIAS